MQGASWRGCQSLTGHGCTASHTMRYFVWPLDLTTWFLTWGRKWRYLKETFTAPIHTEPMLPTLPTAPPIFGAYSLPFCMQLSPLRTRYMVKLAKEIKWGYFFGSFCKSRRRRTSSLVTYKCIKFIYSAGLEDASCLLQHFV